MIKELFDKEDEKIGEAEYEECKDSLHRFYQAAINIKPRLQQIERTPSHDFFDQLDAVWNKPSRKNIKLLQEKYEAAKTSLATLDGQFPETSATIEDYLGTRQMEAGTFEAIINFSPLRDGDWEKARLSFEAGAQFIT